MDQNKKQTAVEWLIYSLDSLEQKNIDNEITLCDYIDQKNNLQEQAKAMEKEQHQITFDMGYEEHIVETWGEEDPKGFEDYFTETYKH